MLRKPCRDTFKTMFTIVNNVFLSDPTVIPLHYIALTETQGVYYCGLTPLVFVRKSKSGPVTVGVHCGSAGVWSSRN